MKKEIILFISLFLLLSLGMHFQQWVDAPLAHLQHLPQSSLGLWHPLLLTLALYLLFVAIRWIYRLIKKLLFK